VAFQLDARTTLNSGLTPRKYMTAMPPSKKGSEKQGTPEVPKPTALLTISLGDSIELTSGLFHPILVCGFWLLVSGFCAFASNSIMWPRLV
jgi:hypothetical protein